MKYKRKRSKLLESPGWLSFSPHLTGSEAQAPEESSAEEESSRLLLAAAPADSQHLFALIYLVDNSVHIFTFNVRHNCCTKTFIFKRRVFHFFPVVFFYV